MTRECGLGVRLWELERGYSARELNSFSAILLGVEAAKGSLSLLKWRQKAHLLQLLRIKPFAPLRHDMLSIWRTIILLYKYFREILHSISRLD